MELMIAVVIAGILASIAYPSVLSFLQRSRRADAVAVLTSVVQAQERYRSNNVAYASSLSALNIDSTGSKYYDFAQPALAASATGYQVTVTPKTGSAQAADARDCATLTIKLEGSVFNYLATGSDNRDTSTVCWPR